MMNNNNDNRLSGEQPEENSVFAVDTSGSCAPVRPAETPQPAPAAPADSQYAQPEYLPRTRQVPLYTMGKKYAQPLPGFPDQASGTAPTTPKPAAETPPCCDCCCTSGRLSLIARILLWIVGVVVGVTLIFGCVLFWVYGINWLSRAISGKAFEQPTQSEDSGEYGFPYSGDFFFNIPGYGNGNGSSDGSNGSGNGSSQQQSSNAGLGITVSAFEPEIGINETYSKGLLIVTINDDSSFVGTDVRVNDLIVAVEGTPTEEINTLKSILAQKNVGDQLTLTIARYVSGVAELSDVTVTLVEIE